MSEVARPLVLRAVDGAAADEVYAVVHAAFAARPALDPPAEALDQTPASLRRALDAGGGLVAEVDGETVGALVLDPVTDPLLGRRLWVRRFGVLPAWQAHGVGAAMVEGVIERAPLMPIAVLARTELPRAQDFWRSHGFAEVARQGHYVELVRPGAFVRRVRDADAMRALGAEVAASLRAGDLVVLTGGLGAGKTTLTQGLAEGLGVRGPITSPTFVIARVHPSLVDGPDLVHVDAYRLGGIEELDDLDLDASLDDAVTVVEWGAGLAEQLTASRLDIVIDRTGGGDRAPELAGADNGAEDDPRIVRIEGHGPRWTF